MSQPFPLNNVPDAILWHEGMLLRPEHFEQMTSRQELLLQHHASMAPFAWGVSRLVVDETALLQGRFTLLELEARLPDGLVLRAAATDPGGSPQPSIDLDALDGSFRQRPFFVYLAVVALQPGGTTALSDLRSVAATEGDETLRQNGTSLPEKEEEEEHLPIPRLRPRFHLIAAEQNISSKYVGMPIVKIVFRNGIWSLDDHYVPPTESATSESPLTRTCSQTLRRVRELAIFTFNRFRVQSASERTEGGSYELTVVRSLAASLPLCEAIVSSGAAHPFTLYLSFCSLAGQVAGLSAEPIPPSFSRYDHNNAAASFAEVDAYINYVLGEGDSREFIGVPFTFSQNVFSVSFQQEWSGRRLILALRATGNNDSGAAAWCENALIGSRSHQRGMRDRRVLGLERTRIDSEKGLFAGQGVILYYLHEDNNYLEFGEPLDLVTGPSSLSTDIPVEIILYIRQISG